MSPTPRATVLIVEDTEEVRNLLASLLRSFNHTVLSAAHGMEAFELFKNQPYIIDMVVTDLHMPYLGGLELARQLLAISPHQLVLIISGEIGPLKGALDELLEQHDSVQFMEKPIYPLQFLEKVHHMLSNRTFGATE